MMVVRYAARRQQHAIGERVAAKLLIKQTA